MSVSPSRRRLLQAAALLPVAACTSEPAQPAKLSGDGARRLQALARESELIRLYDAAIAARPGAAAPLEAIREEHLAHVAALRSPETHSPTPAPSRPATAAPTATALVAAERSAAAAHAAAAVLASRPLAAVLASLAASEAAHVVVLT